MNQSAKLPSSSIIHSILTVSLFAAALLTTGCGSSNETNLGSATELSTEPVAPGKNLSDEQLATELERLEEQAIAFESTNRKQESAQIRQQIHQTISKNVSPESWQAKTAEQIAEAAVRNSQLSPENEQLLQHSKQLFTKFQNQIKFNEHEQARTTAQEIITIYQRIYGQQSMVVAQMLVQIGNAEYQTKISEDAVGHFHNAVQILQGLGLEEHPQLEEAHTGLGALYFRKKKFSPALANQKAATRISARLWGDTSLKYADQANQLGVMYHATGQSDVALQILLASEVLRRKTLGENDPKVGHSLLNIATVLKDLKRYDEAIPTFQRAKASFAASQQFPFQIEQCNSNLATIYMLQNNLPLAEQRLAEVVSSAQSNENSNPVYVAQCKYRYSIALARQGKYNVAQSMMEQVLQVQQKHLGQSHTETLKTMQAYALLLKTTEQTAAADEVYNVIRQVSYESDDNDFER